MPRPVDPVAWGIEPGFVDVFGVRQDAPPDTVAAVLAAMGATPDSPSPSPSAPAADREPARCPLPEGVPAWGWAAQLYAARSATSWGIGDLGDLASLGRWAAARDAGFVLVNPLHAATPVLPQNPSPYFPSSRRFRNVLYLRVEDVPGAGETDIEAAARAGR